MSPNTSPENCSVIVIIYKYFEAESEERHQSIAGIKMSEITLSYHRNMCLQHVLYFSILHCWVYKRFLNSIDMQQWRMIGDE